jgi:hypothetical protein
MHDQASSFLTYYDEFSRLRKIKRQYIWFFWMMLVGGGVAAFLFR